MTITTEEAERLAERLETKSWRHDKNNDFYPEPSGGVFINGVFRGNTAAALRSLAAERDALKAENARLRKAPRLGTGRTTRKCVNAHDRCYGGDGGPCDYCEIVEETQ